MVKTRQYMPFWGENGLYKAIPQPHVGQSDHLSLLLLPKYTPAIKRVKPTVKTVKVWLEEANSLLQQEFQNTDWNMFARQATLVSHTDINIYTSSVLHYINRCVDKVSTQKIIKVFPNQKPWMNKEVRLLLKAHDAAFKTGDRDAYSLSRANLKRGIKAAKHNHKLRIEDKFNNHDPRRMWRGIHAITDYKPSNSIHSTSKSTLLDDLNVFYARFDLENTESPIKSKLPPDHLPLTLTTGDVCSALGRVNAHKAAGPDGIPG